MQTAAGAATVTWTGRPCCRRYSGRVIVKGNAQWGMAVHAVTGNATCAEGHLVAPVDADIVKAAAALKAGERS